MIDRSHPSGLPPDPAEMRFTADDLAEIEPDPDLDADLDAEEAKRDAELRKLGFTEAEISRVRGGRVVPTPEPALADVEAELAEIDKFRREEKIKYFKSDATQKREIELLETRAKLKAEERGEGEASEEDGKADGLGEGSLPESLREEWSRSGPDGIQDALRAVRFRTHIALDALGGDAGEALRDSFDDLPDDAQDAIVSGLATDGGKWPVASEQEVQAFGEVAHGAELLKEWGASAAALLGRARREAASIEARMTERSRLQMHRWVAGRSPAELGAMVRALAARATRRL
jgi:hypothetical protein